MPDEKYIVNVTPKNGERKQYTVDSEANLVNAWGWFTDNFGQDADIVVGKEHKVDEIDPESSYTVYANDNGKTKSYTATGEALNGEGRKWFDDTYGEGNWQIAPEYRQVIPRYSDGGELEGFDPWRQETRTERWDKDYGKEYGDLESRRDDPNRGDQFRKFSTEQGNLTDEEWDRYQRMTTDRERQQGLDRLEERSKGKDADWDAFADFNEKNGARLRELQDIERRYRKHPDEYRSAYAGIEEELGGLSREYERLSRAAKKSEKFTSSLDLQKEELKNLQETVAEVGDAIEEEYVTHGAGPNAHQVRTSSYKGGKVPDNYSKLASTASRNLDIAVNFNEDTERTLNADSDSFLSGMGIVASNPNTYVLDLPESIDKIMLRGIADKMMKSGYDSLTKDEQTAVDAWQRNAEAHALLDPMRSSWFKGGQGAAQSIEFMVEMALTGGIIDAASKGVLKAALEKGLIRGGKELAGKTMLEGLSSLATKGLTGETKYLAGQGVKFAGGLVKGTVQAALNVPMQLRTFGDELLTFDENGNLPTWGEARKSALFQTWAETYTENGVEPIWNVLTHYPMKWAGLAMRSFLPGAYRGLAEMYTKARVSGLGRMMRAGGFQGLNEEVFEELMNAVIYEAGGEKGAVRDFFTRDNLETLYISFAPITLIGGGASMAQVGMAQRNYNNQRTGFEKMLGEYGFDKNQTALALDNILSDPVEGHRGLMRSIYEQAALEGCVDKDGNLTGRWGALGNKMLEFRAAAAQKAIYDGAWESEQNAQMREEYTRIFNAQGGDFLYRDSYTDNGQEGTQFSAEERAIQDGAELADEVQEVEEDTSSTPETRKERRERRRAERRARREQGAGEDISAEERTQRTIDNGRVCVVETTDGRTVYVLGRAENGEWAVMPVGGGAMTYIGDDQIVKGDRTDEKGNVQKMTAEETVRAGTQSLKEYLSSRLLLTRRQRENAVANNLKGQARQARSEDIQRMMGRFYNDGLWGGTFGQDGEYRVADAQTDTGTGLFVYKPGQERPEMMTWDEIYGVLTGGEGTLASERQVDEMMEERRKAEQGELPTEQERTEAERAGTALESLPKDKDGNPVFERAESPAQALDALTEAVGDGEQAANMAVSEAADATRAAEAAAKKADKAARAAQEARTNPKGKTINEKIANLNKAKAEEESTAKEAEEAARRAEFWQGVAREAAERRNAGQAQTENTQQQTETPQAQSESRQEERKEERDRGEFNALVDAARALLEKLNVPYRMITSREELLTMARAQGKEFYDQIRAMLDRGTAINAFVRKGEVWFYAPQIFDDYKGDARMAKARQTIAHEVIAHIGLKNLKNAQKEGGFAVFCRDVYGKVMTARDRERYLAYHWNVNLSVAEKRRMLGLDGNAEVPRWESLTAEQRAGLFSSEYGGSIVTGAADEYIASIAEKIERGEAVSSEERTAWQRFMDWLSRLFGAEMTESDVVDALLETRRSMEGGQAESARTEGNAFSAEERGYEGRSQSTRAKEAREEGKFPMTDFTKEYDIPKESVSLLTGLGLIDDSEWHHTGPNYARTTFYGWSADGALEAYRDNKKEIDRLAREYSAVPETELRSDYGYDKDNIVPSLMSESDRRAYDALLDEHRHDGNYDGEEYDRRRDEYARERERLFAPYRDTEEYRRNAEAVDRYESGREENRARRESIEGQAREVLGETASMFSAEERNEGKALEEIISDSDYEKMELSGDEKAEIENVNDKFNEKLDTFNETNSDRLIFSLGRPTSILRSAGVHDKPMRLHGSKIMKKVRKHGFDPKELRNLPRNVADPIAVFNNKKSEDNRAVLTELRTANGNFLVTIDLGKGSDVDFNIISSVFGKGDDNIADWLKQGYDTYINKEKALEFLFHQSTLNVAAAANEGLVSEGKGSENSGTSKENGENPQFSAEERDIIDKARDEGKLGLAPNGRQSNLYNKYGEHVWAMVRTPQFKNWFGDWEKADGDSSKVVDENGEPLVVYHGSRTGGEFSTFDGTAFFIDNKDIADMFRDDASYFVSVNGKERNTRFGSDVRNIVESLFRGDYEADEMVGNGTMDIKEEWDSLKDYEKEYIRDWLGMDGDEDLETLRIESAQPTFETFLNIRNPYIIDFNDQVWQADENRPEASFEKAREEGHDGMIIRNIVEGGPAAELLNGDEVPPATDYVTFSPNQIKSVGNSGDFSTENDDIRYSAEERELSDAGTRETVSDIEIPENDDRFSAAERVATANEARERLGVELTPDELASTSTRHGAMMTALRKATEDGAIPGMDSGAVLSFLSDTWRDAPEEVRDTIQETASMGDYDIAGETARTLADYVSREVRGAELTPAQREFLDNAARTIAERLGISEDNAKYVLWQHSNAGNDLVTDEERQAMRNALGVSTPASDYEAGVQSELRFSAAREDSNDSAAEIYSRAMGRVAGALNEVGFNEYRAIDSLVEAVSGQTGREYTGWDPRKAFNQLTSNVKARIEAYLRDYFDPMSRTIDGISRKRNISKDKLAEYAALKHGLERNRVLHERDTREAEEKKRKAPERRDYSGLGEWMREYGEYATLDELEAAAQAKVDEYEEILGDSAGELWDAVRAATAETLRIQLRNGLITRETYDRISSMFGYYVPLQGFAEDTNEDKYEYMGGFHDGSTGTIGKRAKGRKSRAANPFARIGLNAEKTIMEAEKNRAKQALYYFLRANSDNDLTSFGTVWYVKTGRKEGDKDVWEVSAPALTGGETAEELRSKIGAWEEEMRNLEGQGLAKRERDRLDLGDDVVFTYPQDVSEHSIDVLVDGYRERIYVNGDPRAAQAANGLLKTRNAAFEKTLKRLSRYTSTIYTSGNPQFFVTNFARDIGFATFNVYSKEGMGYLTRFLGNALRCAQIGLLSRKFRNGNTDAGRRMQRLYELFAMNGGITGYSQVRGEDYFEKEIEKSLGAGHWLWKALTAIPETFRTITENGENLLRFAAFLTSYRDGRGKSLTDSIADAKDVTVNFNRRGTGRAISAREAERLIPGDGMREKAARLALQAASGLLSVGPAYSFFNVSMQGMSQLFKNIRQYPQRSVPVLVCYAGLGLLNGIIHGCLNAAMGGDAPDPDDPFYNIPDWERRTNFIIQLPGGNYIKIPISQELRPFYALGDMIGARLAHKTAQKDLPVELLSLFGEMLPINPLGEGGLGQSLAPTIASPLVDLMVNRDYRGLNIIPERYGGAKGTWLYSYGATPDWAVAASRALNGVLPMLSMTDIDRKRMFEREGFWKGMEKGLYSWDSGDSGVLDVSPEAVQHLAEGYAGGLLTFVSMCYETAESVAKGEDVNFRRVPYVNRFYGRPQDRQTGPYLLEMNRYAQKLDKRSSAKMDWYLKNIDTAEAVEFSKTAEFYISALYSGFKDNLKKINEAMASTDDEQAKMTLIDAKNEMLTILAEWMEEKLYDNTSRRSYKELNSVGHRYDGEVERLTKQTNQ